MAYVYRHIRHDKNEPFYIGIGSDRYYKRSRNKRTRNPIWKEIAKKTDFDIEILMDGLTQDESYKKEIEFIKLYGRICLGTGTLANISDGGEISAGFTPENRKKYSIKYSGAGNPFYGKKHTEEAKAGMRWAAGLKRPLTEQQKKNIGIANKGRTPWCKGKKDAKGELARTGVNHGRYLGEVSVFDLAGNLINHFKCSRDAADFYGIKQINDIRRVAVGDRGSYKGMVFKFIKPVQP